MDWKKQLENNEKNWSIEKMESLKCFDNERKEWESQLKDLQRKVHHPHTDCLTNLRMRAVTPARCFRYIIIISDRCRSYLREKLGSEMVLKGLSNLEQIIVHGMTKKFIEELPLENFKEGVHRQNLGSEQNAKKKCSSVLNAALQEIAKVSEELCSYQEEIQKKKNSRRTSYPSLQACEEKGHRSISLRNELTSKEKNCMTNDIFKAFHPTLSQHQRVFEELPNEANWNHSPWDKYGISADSFEGNTVTDISPTREKAPPVPPRTSSLNFASSLLGFPQHLNDVLKESSSNNGATLQENEQKVLEGGRDFKTLAPLIEYETGPQCSKNNCSKWLYDATNLDLNTEYKYIGSKVRLSSDESQVSTLQEQSLGKNSRSMKYLPPKTNPVESNFPNSSKAIGIFNTSGVYLKLAKDVPSPQADCFRKTVDPVVCGKSVVHSAADPGQGSSFVICSVGNVDDTRQLPSKPSSYELRPHNPLTITNTKLAEQKHCHGLPHQIEENVKRQMFDKVNTISNAFSNFDIGQTQRRKNERPSNPSFQMKNKVGDFRTKQDASCSNALHDNLNRIPDLFQTVHLNREKEVERKSRQSQRASGQKCSLPATLPVTVRLNEMSFSRPARPQNRRLPSRWAIKSPSAPDTHKQPSRCDQAFRFDTKTSGI
ncbi:protein SOGA3a [Narcine bancroftii]|uniref:protein SOGA3a n=1 Tax=Narcine bancroftii TaxID=1343680 RepID=UPI00383144B7